LSSKGEEYHDDTQCLEIRTAGARRSCLTHSVFLQAVDGAGSCTVVAWAISVANKGISASSTFMRDKPAAIGDMSIRGGGFSVDPTLAAPRYF